MLQYESSWVDSVKSTELSSLTFRVVTKSALFPTVCRIMSFPVKHWQILLYIVIPCQILSYNVKFCHILSFPVKNYRIMSSLVVYCHSLTNLVVYWHTYCRKLDMTLGTLGHCPIYQMLQQQKYKFIPHSNFLWKKVK